VRIRIVAVLGLLCLSVPALAQDTEPARPSRAADGRVERFDRTSWSRARYGAIRPGLHLRVLRDYTLAEGASASEAIVVIGGDARIDGEARDDVTVLGGTLTLGPTAVVGGRVTVIGSEAVIAPGAQVRGPVDRIAVWWPTVTFGPIATPGDWAGLRALLAALRLGFVLALVLVLTVAAPGWIRAIAARPVGVSGLIGLTTEVAFVPAMALLSLALVVTIVGIPLLGLLPFLLLLGGVVWAAGFAGVAARIGGLDEREEASRLAPAGRLLRGYAVIVSVTVAGHLLALGPDWLDTTAAWVRATGFVVEFAAWTVGLGAGLASLFVSRRVPRLPPASAA